MKKYIPLCFLLLAIVITTSASNITKPISSQYGFIENKGQIIDQNNKPNPHVLYLYNGNGLHVQLRKDGFSYEVMNMVKTPKAVIDITPTSKFATQADSFDITYQIHRVDINFKGSNKSALLKPYEPAKDYINYYTTVTPEEGITYVHHFKKVVYENVYPNIDIEFVLNDASNKGKFKYNFIVKPHANLADIQLEFIGANRTSLTKEGNILIETAYGNLEENIPLSYVINKDDSHNIIKATFLSITDNIFGINAENYNHNQTLVIDPINWSTYYGGTSFESGYAITTDESGNIIITGITNSGNATATVGAHQAILGGNTDALIAKFNGNGVMQWATYFGGSNYDAGSGIKVDISGNLIMTGYTNSTSAVATSGAYQINHGNGITGGYDAFIAKFNTYGVRQWATYYGGSGADEGRSITTDSSGSIFVAGYTVSTTAIATSGAHQTIHGGGSYDVFLTKFNANGQRQWATYYGGGNHDYVEEIVIDKNWNVIISGQTYSTTAIATSGAYQTILGGGKDAFIAKFNTNGVRLWASYYGGSGDDEGSGIATDENGNLIMTGYTTSTNAIAIGGVHQTIYGGGGYDAFITKFNANGVRLWGTYYGGTGHDHISGITMDVSGSIIIAGYTASTNAIASGGVHQTVFGGGPYDAFIAKFNAIGAIQWGTYYGGAGSDYINGIAQDASGNILITGATNSSNAIASSGVHQTVFGGSSSDVLIAKFSVTGMLPVKLISFNAVLSNDKVNCTWETASEINNDYFTVERSVNGDDFEDVGTVKGRGNSSTTSRYHFTDNNPFEGISYYRFKQTDFDGKYTYSSIQKVGSIDKSDAEISLYYKNYHPMVKVNSLIETTAIVELINLSGITIFTNKQPIALGENTFAINGDNLNQGLYLLKVQLENKVTLFKVWIK